jgi:hypothetical protein
MQVVGTGSVSIASDIENKTAGKRNCNRGKPGKRARRAAAEDAVERLQLFQSESSTLDQRNMAQQRCALVEQLHQ